MDPLSLSLNLGIFIELALWNLVKSGFHSHAQTNKREQMTYVRVCVYMWVCKSIDKIVRKCTYPLYTMKKCDNFILIVVQLG